MKILKHLFLTALLASSLPMVIRAQTNPIETDANLKDSTTHVVVERKVYEKMCIRDRSESISIFGQPKTLCPEGTF